MGICKDFISKFQNEFGVEDSIEEDSFSTNLKPSESKYSCDNLREKFQAIIDKVGNEKERYEQTIKKMNEEIECLKA